MEKIYKLNVLICRSQVLNPAGLRRFPSPHPSLFFLDFWWNFRAQMRREGEGQPFYRGGTPVARGGGRHAPCRACGPGPAAVARGPGDRACFFFSRDFVANLKKKLHIGPVALWEGDRGIFLKFSKTDIYF